MCSTRSSDECFMTAANIPKYIDVGQTISHSHSQHWSYKKVRGHPIAVLAIYFSELSSLMPYIEQWHRKAVVLEHPIIFMAQLKKVISCIMTSKQQKQHALGAQP